jgi:hypothetical protein
VRLSAGVDEMVDAAQNLLANNAVIGTEPKEKLVKERKQQRIQIVS